MELQVKIKGISELEQKLNPFLVQKASARALNRAGRAGFTEGSKLIRQKYNLKAKDIKKATKVTRARIDNLKVILDITGGPIPFKYFRARQTKKGVTVKIRKGGARTLIRGAFIGGYIPIKRKTKRGISVRMEKRTEWGGGHVFIRKGKRRTPIVKLATGTVIIPVLFRKYLPQIEKRVNEVFNREFWHSYNYLAGR